METYPNAIAACSSCSPQSNAYSQSILFSTSDHWFSGITITGARSIVSPCAILRRARIPRPQPGTMPRATLKLLGSTGITLALIITDQSIPPVQAGLIRGRRPNFLYFRNSVSVPEFPLERPADAQAG